MPSKRRLKANLIIPGDQTLLGLCDSVRGSIQEDEDLGPRGLEMVAVLKGIIEGEQQEGPPAISLGTIRSARLDRLLSDIINVANHKDSASPLLRTCALAAEALQRRWMTRFRESYFGLGHYRRRCLLSSPGGLLENMTFDKSAPTTNELWKPRRVSKGKTDCNISAGQ